MYANKMEKHTDLVSRDTRQVRPSIYGSARENQFVNEDDQIAMQVLADTLFGKGWSRALPASMIEVFTQILFEQPPTRAELDARLRQSRHSPEELDSSAWEPLHDWTDEEIARLDEDFGQPDDEPRAASELNAKEAAQREIDLATFERYLAAKEVPVAHTIGALLDLLIACDVVNIDDSGMHSINPLAPLPGEALPLDADEAVLQDSMRWERLHEATAQEIIHLFRPEGAEVDHLLTDLGQLAKHLDQDPEDVRSALLALLGNGDFSAGVNIETVTVHDSFILRIDWEAFRASRISIRHGSPNAD